MATTVGPARSLPWWKEPTKDQWMAWWAAWLGWTLDAFDFTVFLLIMVPISKEFGVSLTEVAAVLTITLWMRLVGACASGWLADRVGRKTPLMLSIAWYSVCNFIAGFSPTFGFLFLFRALLGIGMGAEWPAGAALAMESWPARSRGIMSGILQGSWSLGFLLSSLVYGLFYPYLGWRGMLWIGILPAFAVIFVRYFVKESAVWVENQRLQREQKREVRAPLLQIFKRGLIGNTLSACWWMTSAFVIYYSIWSLFATHLQKDLNFSPAQVAMPIAIANFLAFLASGFWGWTADHIGRRWCPGGGQRLLLSPGGDLRWAGGPDAHVLCPQLPARLRHPHAGRHGGRRRQLRLCPAAWPGDQGQGTRRRPDGGAPGAPSSFGG